MANAGSVARHRRSTPQSATAGRGECRPSCRCLWSRRSSPSGHAAAVPPVGTPGSSTQWRMLVEEHELLDADDPQTQDQNAEPIRLPRLVYADAVAL